MTLVIFTVIFFLIVNRHWIRSLIEGLVKPKVKSKNLNDKNILNFIESKTGLKLQNIKLIDTRATWAMMSGLPSRPYLILSYDAYRNFSKDEFQWLLLHEAGHFLLLHNIKMIFLQLGFLALGFYILLQFNLYLEPLLLSILLAILFSILYVQATRRFEYEANYFALSKMDNPKGLKNMYEKARKRWMNKGRKEDTLWHKLFNVWVLDIYKDLVKKATI